MRHGPWTSHGVPMSAAPSSAHVLPEWCIAVLLACIFKPGGPESCPHRHQQHHMPTTTYIVCTSTRTDTAKPPRRPNAQRPSACNSHMSPTSGRTIVLRIPYLPKVLLFLILPVASHRCPCIRQLIICMSGSGSGTSSGRAHEYQSTTAPKSPSRLVCPGARPSPFTVQVTGYACDCKIGSRILTQYTVPTTLTLVPACPEPGPFSQACSVVGTACFGA